MILLAIDPGGTSGIALFEVHDDRPIELIRADQWHSGVLGFIDMWRHECMDSKVDLVVSESFRLDGRTPSPDVSPLRIEGALLALAQCPLIWQQNVMKAHAPDELLKRAGLYQRGMPHANDAIRHAIAWSKLNGHRPTIEWLWPMPAQN